MHDPQANTIDVTETRALGDYALRRAGRTEHVKSKFAAHMFQKRRIFLHFNPFDHVARRPGTKRKPGGKEDKATEELKKLKQVTREAQEVITSANSFALFPDTITVDRHKLTIVYRTFFKVEQTVSVPLRDIKNIQADMGPFFGSLTVTSDHFINNTQTIRFLWRKDVKNIQELVQGAMVATNEAIDITKVATKELSNLLTDLGKGHSATTT